MKKFLLTILIAVFACSGLFAQQVSREYLIGIWESTIEYNRSFDTYRIIFYEDGRCSVKITNESADQETTGNWTLEGTTLRINAVFRNARISYQNNIQWTAMINFFGDNNAFNINVRPARNGAITRFTFYKQGDVFNESIIPLIFNALSERIPLNSQLAVVNISASNPREASYYLNELTSHFVNSRRFRVLDRQNVDTVLAEHDFQLSGLVSDDEVVSIGEFLGASIVITGTISGTGLQRRLTVKAIDVRTGEIIAMPWVDL